jgi:phosphoglycolate phosphatase
MRTALVDLDGTLTDPADGILGGFRFALQRMGAPLPDRSELTWVIGPPLRQAFPRLIPDPTPARVEEAVAAYREYYGGTGILEASVYAGIPETLERLRALGYRLVLCTVKPRVFAGPVLEHFGLASFFDGGVYGAELDGRFEDKADIIAHIVAQHGLAPEAVTMIGDRGLDMSAAARNGVTGIGVTWGYGTAEELRAAGASLLCSTPGELVPAVAAQLGA